MLFGIDWGGTKIEIIALTSEGEETFRHRRPTPQNDYHGCIRTVVDLVAAATQATGVHGGSIGVGIPGTLSPASGLVKNANSTWLNGQPLDRDLEAALGQPVRIANDANCLAISEAVDGAGAGARVVFAVVIGTGAGAGIAVDTRAVTGANAIAGEWGHVTLPWMTSDEFPGPACWCGKHGCIETMVSGTGFARDFAAATGEAVSALEILRRHRTGDVAATAALKRYIDRLGRGLAMIVNILDPNVIVLGGGLSNIDVLYDVVPNEIARHTFSDRIDTPVRRALHGDSSGVRGAAWLWREIT